jgi:hypothetical protein
MEREAVGARLVVLAFGLRSWTGLDRVGDGGGGGCIDGDEAVDSRQE